MNAKHAQKAKGREHEQDSSSQEEDLSERVPDELVDTLNQLLDKAKTAGEPVPTPSVPFGSTLRVQCEALQRWIEL